MKKRLGLWLAVAASLGVVVFALGRRASSDGTAIRERVPPAPGSAPRFVEEVELGEFLRGNIHVHTRMSDGDSSPQQVVSWYEENGYDFVAITDHNRRVEPERFSEGLRPGFLLVPGEEITMAASGKPVHVNALCTRETIGDKRFNSRPEAILWATERVAEQGGVALVNHPNFMYALDLEHLRETAGTAHMLDIFNGHPQCHSDGSEEHPSVERLWQKLLDAGVMIAPAAVDDAHAFTPEPPAGVPNSRPGTGWIGVAAAERTVEGVCDAMRTGRVYASTGVRVSRVQVAATQLSVWVAEPGVKVDFIGRRGEVLASVEPELDGDHWVARYALQGEETFVRARVESPGGRAWTPAFAVRKLPAA